MTDPETRFDAALRELAVRPAPTPPPFAAARISARLAADRTTQPGGRRDLRPWLAAAAFALLGVALHRTSVPTLPAPEPVPPAPQWAPGVVVFALDSQTTLYFAMPTPGELAEEEPS